MHPYWGKNLIEFIFVFIKRLPFLITNQTEIVSDEIQILALCLIGITCATLGSFTVLRKETMLANSLSHTILLGIVFSYLLFVGKNGYFPYDLNLKILLFASFLTAFFTTTLYLFCKNVLKLQKDASIGYVFTSLFALGLLLVTLFTKNAHIGVEIVMGNADLLHFEDVKQMFFLACVNVFLTTIFYRYYLITTFDASLARILKISPFLFRCIFMFQLSMTIVGSFRAVGVILVLSYLVTPFLIARCYTSQLKKILFLAPIVACVVSFFSVAISRHLLSVHNIAISTASVCVVFLAFFYLSSLIILSFRKSKKVRSV